MRLNRILRLAIPFFAGISLIGTGYAIFSFGTLNLSTTFSGNDAPSVDVSGKADVGTLTVSTVNQETSDGTVNYVPFDQQKYLVIMQNRIYFNFSHFELNYTPPTTWESGVSVPITINAEMRLGGNITDYFLSNTWNLDENDNTLYTYSFGPFNVNSGENSVIHLIAPTLTYKADMEPEEMKDVLDIQNNILNDSSSLISFSFDATLRGDLDDSNNQA